MNKLDLENIVNKLKDKSVELDGHEDYFYCNEDWYYYNEWIKLIDVIKILKEYIEKEKNYERIC